MATTATITITSADIAGDPVNVSKTLTCTKAGSTVDLDQTTGLNRVHLRSATQKTLLAGNAEGNDLAVTINAQTIGKLYGGAFMFIPWSQTDDAANIEVAATNWTSSTGDIPVEYALFHEDLDHLTNA